ncbi:MAG TPA: peptide chain release factor N(5)-glutamine methyltransferase [Puia sp.]|jgi:release factor glutamine methyltransferase
MDWQQAQKELITLLTPLYGDREAAAIADWTMENLSGRKKIDRLLHRSASVPPAALDTYQKYTRQLLAHRPVQYVLHESWFAGMKLYVDENVLIPRPETEELVEWILSSPPPANPTLPQPKRAPTILDVGTGSGCIPLALAKNLPSAKIHACDISPNALAVARRNAEALGLPITLHQLDFLDPQSWDTLPQIDCLVSNPPYIPIGGKAEMAAHVVDFEPGLALFVPDSDALVFYRALSQFARQRLPEGGQLFVEIHEEMGTQVQQLFREAGLTNVTLRQDLQGKDRMVKATR